MNPTKSFIIIMWLLVFAASISAQSSKGSSVRITLKDKSKIIQQIFADGFDKLMKHADFSQCTIPIVNNEKIILIETNKANIFPKLSDEYRFKFMNRKEIEDEIKSNNGDCYFKLNNFQITGSNSVKITLWRWIEVITVVNGKSWYPSRWIAARGLVYESSKVNKKWNTKLISSSWAIS